MFEQKVVDWDNAYANSANIAGSDRWPAAWTERAELFRQRQIAAGKAKLDIRYGEKPRNLLDFFLPQGTPKGLVVLIHGGFWLAFDKSAWSHLASGPLDSGYAVVVPSYTLCPQARLGEIVREIGIAIEKAAGLIAGPIALTGHSAGGHLVSRMVCASTPLPPIVQARVRNVVSISGLHDLRPLMNTAMNKTLRIDEAEALAESPALRRPMTGARVTCWVGGNERHEFLRQSALLANIWTGMGATTATVIEPDRHHFSVIDGLTEADHALTRTLLS